MAEINEKENSEIPNNEEKNETLILIDNSKIETYKELNATKTQINVELLKEEISIKQVKINTLKDTPLYMPWIRRNLWEMLWYWQSDEILKKYNDIDPKKNSKKGQIPLSDLDKVNFPLIYDELRNYFPNKIDDLKINHKIKWKDLIYITKLENWLHSLAYYKEWKLYIATYISPGLKDKHTPEWEFKINFKEHDKRSRKYDDAPMAYAMNINWWIYIHQWKSDWTQRSHWCVRVPWFYEQELYSTVKINTPVIIDF